MKNSPSYVVVIGASAGGLGALTELVAQFQPGMDAAVFVVLHLSRKGISDFLVHKLQQHTLLPCSIATHNSPIEKGQVYIAPPNKHLLIKKDRIIIGNGPEENRWRPSIDVLFRSAAAAFSTRTICIILTGLLDDGTSGMWAIKRSGGTCIVQDPNEAEYPDMALSVVNNCPCRACPDCGGGLYNQVQGSTTRYRCHIGHSFRSVLCYQTSRKSSGNTLGCLTNDGEKEEIMEQAGN